MSITNDFGDVAAAADAQARAYSQRAAQTTQDQADAVSSIADTWPQMDPGLVLPLGQQGLTGDHPVVQQAATQAVKAKAQKGLLSRIGDDVKGVTLRPATALGGVIARNVLDPVKSVVPHPVATGFGDAMKPVKGLTRMSFDVLNAPPQLIQAGFRDALQGQFDPAHAAGELAQTNLGQYVIQGVTHGGHVDTGSGFFDSSTSAVSRGQSAAARAAAPLMNGHATTVGRWVAAKVTEPGTRPYNVLSGLLDAGVSLSGGKNPLKVADHAAPQLGGEARSVVGGADGVVRSADQAAATSARTAVTYGPTASGGVAKTGTDYGLVDGTRKTILPERAVTWLNSGAGNRFAQFAADSKDFNAIWTATGKKLPVDLVLKLQDATDPVEVKRILAGELGSTSQAVPNTVSGIAAGTTATNVPSLLGTTLRDAPSVSAGQAAQAAGQTPGIISQVGLKVQRVKQQSALLQNMPGQAIDLNDPDGAVKTLDGFQRIAKLPEATISANNAKLARALSEPTGGGAALQAISHTLDTVEQVLTAKGMSVAHAQQMTAMWSNTVQELRHFNVNDIGENVKFPGAQIGDDGLPIPSPHLFVEYLNNSVPLPNIRDIRTAVSRMSAITGSLPAKLAQQASDVVANNVFKPWTLLRAAWPVRVIGEEQARMGAAGYASAFHHPINYMAMVAGQDPSSALGKILGKLGNDTLSTDALGDTWHAQADAALSEDANNYAKAMSHRAAGYIDPSNGIVTRHFPLFTKGVDAGFSRAWAHELKLLNVDPISSRIARAMDAIGADAKPLPEAIDDIKSWLWEGAGQKIRQQLADNYQARQARSFLPANNNPFLDPQQVSDYVDSVYQRVLAKTSGHPQLVNAVATGKVLGVDLSKGLDINPKAADQLDTLTDYAPQKVTGPLRVYGSGKAASELAARYQSAVNWGFDQLMSKPTNTLSRSPVFRQAYWQRISEMAPYLDAKSATKAAATATQAGAKDAADALRAGGHGALSLDDADELAKKHALDAVQNLLYGASKRSNFFDAYRAIFPFGDAWREVLTRWAKLSAANPAVLLRSGQIVNSSRQSGFLHTDPQSGQEVFTYPGSQMLTQLLTGVPVPMEAPASGLNMVSNQMLPGFGPVVQVAAGQFIPQIPQTQTLRDFLMPYGAADDSGGGASGVLESFVPAWLKKFQTASKFATPQQQRQLMATTNQVMDYLWSTGKYDISTPDGQQKLIKDAQSKAALIWQIRGMAQFGAPSTPEPEIEALDKNGKLQTLYSLQDGYRQIEQKDPTNATADFMNTYGPLALAATNPTSDGSFPATTSVYDFAQANPSLVKKYPTLYGYFAPAGGQYSGAEYNKQVKSGERKPVTAQQNLDITNQRMATAIYNQLKAQVAGRTDSAAASWLSSARDKLNAMFPQLGPTSDDTGTIAQQMQRLQLAAKDPQVASTESGKALQIYMQARDQANQAAKNEGLASFATAKKAEPLRAWMRAGATKLEAQYPDFANLYDQVLSREMTNDDNQSGAQQ